MHLRKVFEILQIEGYNFEENYFITPFVMFLGLVVFRNGLTVDLDKVKAINANFY